MIDKEQFYITLSFISFIIIVLGIFHKWLKRSAATEPMIAVFAGFVAGPYMLDIINFSEWKEKSIVMDMISSLCLGMGLMATALNIPYNFLIKKNKKVIFLLILLMPMMFIASSLIIHFVFRLDLNLSFLLGAIITPTDPVLASVIISGTEAKEVISPDTRYTLSFESGANDGLVFPFVMLPLLILNNPEHIFKNWLLGNVLLETLGGILLGSIAGFTLGKIYNFSIKKNLTSGIAIFSFSVTLSFLLLSSFELININGMLAVFVSGIALKIALHDQKNLQIEKAQAMMERFFTIPVFIFFGITIPFSSWISFGWKAIIMVVLLLILRRLPFLFLLRKFFPDFKIKDIAFIGWFGPIGVASIYYAFYCYRKIHIPEIWAIISLIVFFSVIIHGVTSYFFVRLYRKWKNS